MSKKICINLPVCNQEDVKISHQRNPRLGGKTCAEKGPRTPLTLPPRPKSSTHVGFALAVVSWRSCCKLCTTLLSLRSEDIPAPVTIMIPSNLHSNSHSLPARAPVKISSAVLETWSCTTQKCFLW